MKRLSENGKKAVYYLDNAATSWPKPENVYKACEKQMRQMFGNPGRSGSAGMLETDRLIYKTRLALSKLFNIKDASRIAFALNGTDAINMALKGFLKPGDHVLHTAIDHNAVLRPLKRLEMDKIITTTTVPCSEKGYPSLDFLATALKRKTNLLVINHASNVTGTISPLEEMINLAHNSGTAVLVDTAQTAGSVPIDTSALNIDMLAFTGHKGLLGPTGTGGLYLRPGLEISPLREGGTGSQSELLTQPKQMPERLEAGTLNSAGLAGLLAGLSYIDTFGLEKIRASEQSLRTALYNKLSALPGVKIFGPGANEPCTAIVSATFGDADNAKVAYALENEFSVLCRTGLHCAPLAHQAIHSFPQGTLRFSPGSFTTMADIEYLIEALKQVLAAN